MAKKMTGSKGKSMGYMSKSSGGQKDGARPSKKHQVSALLPQNKMSSALKGRKSRIAKMEKSDAPM